MNPLNQGHIDLPYGNKISVAHQRYYFGKEEQVLTNYGL